MHISGILSGIGVGLVIGLLGRLVVPGRQAIGCLLTILLGIGGAVAGAYAGYRLDVGTGLTFLLQVIAAAVLVALVAGRQRRRR